MYYFPSSLSYSITYLCTVYTRLLLLFLFCIYSILGFILFGEGSFWPFFVSVLFCPLYKYWWFLVFAYT